MKNFLIFPHISDIWPYERTQSGLGILVEDFMFSSHFWHMTLPRSTKSSKSFGGISRFIVSFLIYDQGTQSDLGIWVEEFRLIDRHISDIWPYQGTKSGLRNLVEEFWFFVTFLTHDPTKKLKVVLEFWWKNFNFSSHFWHMNLPRNSKWSRNFCSWIFLRGSTLAAAN